MVLALKEKIVNRNASVCVVGLGYVGYPLAKAFSEHLPVIGLDISERRLATLRNEGERTIELTSDPSTINRADVTIICVPTPITKVKDPDLGPVESAARMVGKHLKRGSIVVLESTVYPGVTEEIVAPILEKESGLRCGIDFKVGYSPERINPGDTEHTIDKITKIVSGMDEETAEALVLLYGLVTTPYLAKNIKTAEAAKAIENIQRDLNIALANELTLIFHRMGLDTKEVMDAAGTKWNFVKYNPGMVGGHCIPVDPYYMVFKARELGHNPQVILAGRSTNDSMPKYVAEMAIKGLNEAGKAVKGSKVLIMGLTYKENVPDVRESPITGLVDVLKEYRAELYGYDPLLTNEDIERFGVTALTELPEGMDCVIIATAHDCFREMSIQDVGALMGRDPVLIDVKGIYSVECAKDMIHKKL
jgi:UDPglucose 6-dehydrogenase/UDP-N-acetyl-D-galactosamine dehydrogenase